MQRWGSGGRRSVARQSTFRIEECKEGDRCDGAQDERKGWRGMEPNPTGRDSRNESTTGDERTFVQAHT
jgi:hypothetical protein